MPIDGGAGQNVTKTKLAETSGPEPLTHVGNNEGSRSTKPVSAGVLPCCRLLLLACVIGQIKVLVKVKSEAINSIGKSNALKVYWSRYHLSGLKEGSR